MGVLADDNGNPRSGYNTSLNSGYNGMLKDGTMYTGGIDFPNAKYYDLYMTMSSLTACNGGICYGHGLSEVSNWYDDSAVFVGSDSHWFTRSSSFSDDPDARVGAFNFSHDFGCARDYVAARSVLLVDS